MKNKVLIGLGGNVGNVKNTLLKSIQLISTKIGPISQQSSIYKTAAWGIKDQAPFLNQALVLQTMLTPLQVLEHCLSIENELGRDRINGKKWEERVIDIDLLFYNDQLIDLPQLQVPHPFVQDRNFVLIPLVEITPEFIHPTLHKTMLELASISPDKMKVIKLLE